MKTAILEYEKLKRDLPGTITKINPASECQKLNILSLINCHIAHELKLQISQDFQEALNQNQNC